ncbi:MAG: helix-turn-helix transcriptional regulator [Clostridia bacterium]|nr:helix-turn-helix transcriptional regulator [Clostridia bacterium]
MCSLYNEYFKSKYTPNNERSVLVKQYVDAHFKDKTCIADASALCGVTVRRFNDLFKGWYLTSPNKYIVSKKIELAKLLLASGPISISDVATMCGFSDVYYFSKCFKAYCNITPSEYQKTYNKI